MSVCGRPHCTQRFTQPASGWRHVYCSDLCVRRAAQEQHTLRTRICHHRDIIDILTRQLAAYGDNWHPHTRNR